MLDDVELVRLTYRDNCWCPDVMTAEATRDFDRDPITAASIWNGDLWKTTDEIIFHNFVTEDFDIDEVIEELKSAVHVGHSGFRKDQRERRFRQYQKIENSFFCGFDHGWVDPCAGIELYFDEKNKRIFAINELYQRKLKLTEIGKRLKECIPRTGEGWPVQVDNARPDVIDHLRDCAINAQSCKKIQIKERIDALQTYLIVVHPRCENLLMELSSYRWQKDRNDAILPVPIDEQNHILDSISYALSGELVYGKTGYRTFKNDPYL
ncbi:MAG: hypothetical protein HN368_03095 [Spirochaetales bacterium]|jgi:phage terminase large subunit|nr:hypothetical protein [Spirochaetales bacterium]